MEKEKATKGKDETKDMRIVHEVEKSVKAELAEKHGKENLRLLELDTDDTGKEAIEVAVLVPTRQVQGQFMKFVDNDPLKAQKILIKACLLTSVDKVQSNDYLFNTCMSGISELFPIGQYKVKNF